jgi:hypothetical protein
MFHFFAGPKKLSKKGPAPVLAAQHSISISKVLYYPCRTEVGRKQASPALEIECWGRRAGGAGSQVVRASVRKARVNGEVVIYGYTVPARPAIPRKAPLQPGLPATRGEEKRLTLFCAIGGLTRIQADVMNRALTECTKAQPGPRPEITGVTKKEGQAHRPAPTNAVRCSSPLASSLVPRTP